MKTPKRMCACHMRVRAPSGRDRLRKQVFAHPTDASAAIGGAKNANHGNNPQGFSADSDEDGRKPVPGLQDSSVSLITRADPF